jgi:hypothetical protein
MTEAGAICIGNQAATSKELGPALPNLLLEVIDELPEVRLG